MAAVAATGGWSGHLLRVRPGPHPQLLQVDSNVTTSCSARHWGGQEARPQRFSPRRPVILCAATDNASKNINGENVEGMHESMEMFVAHSATPRKGSGSILEHVRRIAKRVVPPPFSANKAPQSTHNGTADVTAVTRAGLLMPAQDEAAALASAASRQTRAVQAELAMTAAELRDKSRELAETQRALRKRDGEVMGLKAMISRKDENLKQARAFLVEARVQVQEKDGQLQSALEQLTEAAKERARLRQDLISAQHDLTYTRSELEKWTAHLSELRDVMESVDVDTLEEMVEEDWNVAATGQVPSSIMEDSKYLDMLMDLNSLASELAKEAEQDDIIFEQLNDRLDKDTA